MKWNQEVDNAKRPLIEKIEYIKGLLVCLEKIHEHKQLHLEIHPGKIYVQGKSVILEVPQEVRKPQCRNSYPKVSRRYEEYAAPELRLQKNEQIGYASDIYSVTAVFYLLLTGHCPRDQDIFTRKRFRKLTPGLQVFQDVSEEAVKKTIQIVRKGMHPLIDKRYQTVEALEEDLEILLNMIY